MRYDINYQAMQKTADEINNTSKKIDDLNRRLETVRGNLSASLLLTSFMVPQCRIMVNNVAVRSASAKQAAALVKNFGNAINSIRAEYLGAENRVSAVLPGNAPESLRGAPTNGNVFANEFSKHFGWKEALAGAGYIGVLYNMFQQYKKSTSLSDYAKVGVNAYQFLSDAAKTYSNYMKIGNAVGKKTALTWWAKNITGIKPLGRVSTAKSPFTRFANNLTNKTSPFNAQAQFKNVVGNFKGANGVGKAFASWGGVILSGVSNYHDNRKEQANSNGQMSNARVIAETVTETAVDTVLAYGSGIVVGAAIAAFSPVALPGIVVVAATGVVVAGINAGVKTLTGKPTTEWISDTILDTGEAIGKAVGNAAKNVTKSVGSWFGKLLN